MSDQPKPIGEWTVDRIYRYTANISRITAEGLVKHINASITAEVDEHIAKLQADCAETIVELESAQRLLVEALMSARQVVFNLNAGLQSRNRSEVLLKIDAALAKIEKK